MLQPQAQDQQTFSALHPWWRAREIIALSLGKMREIITEKQSFQNPIPYRFE